MIYALEKVSSIKTGGRATGVRTQEIGGKIYALVAIYDFGLKIIDVDDP